ncbi:glycosyltransferase family 4 protein [bacterium]|nr:glycosyltransferase family 4 protein [bacterium]
MTAPQKKTVLVVTYYFPPSGGAGVQRALKFVKYLPEFGWDPVVLTVKANADFPARDESLLAEVPPGIEIVRTGIFEPYALYRKWTGKAGNAAIDIETNTGLQRPGARERFADFIRSTFFIPDARRFWKPSALAAAEGILKRRKVDAIVSTAPPYTCHLIAESIRRRHRIPWVADFRDSWVGWLSTPDRWWLPDRIDRALERKVLRNADRILAVSEGVRSDLSSRHPDIPEGKWKILTNGFDAADFEGLNPKPDADRFVITYTGSLYGKRNPSALLRAARSLKERRPELAEKLLIRFIGRVDSATLDAFRTLGRMFEHVPYVPHSESLRCLLESSALLLVIDTAAAAGTIVTGKVYEYLGAGRPILALAPEGDAAHLIRSLGAGAVVAPDDPEDVERILEEWITAWQANGPIPRPSAEAVRRYERKTLTGELAQILKQIIR